MIHRRKDLPILDPRKMRLPRDPRVLELVAERYTAPGEDEWLNVFVVVDALTAEQETDFSWTIPIRAAIRKELVRQDDERFPVLRLRLKSEWTGPE